ncbi:MAG: hypothetical protein H8E60_01905 [Candidatus Marinimicrobia bacterium]|nr:hypothetical protein [Candidatus Neomarinimicrobiota bacterium]
MKIKEKIGYVIFGLSCFIGYIIPVVFTFIYTKTHDNTWLIRSGFSYRFSWILFGLFILISGKSAFQKIKSKIKSIIF